jgi:hypothetical protein
MVKRVRKNYDRSYDDLLDKSRDCQEVEAIDHEGDDENAKCRAKHAAATAEYARAANDDGPNGLKQKIACAKNRLAGDHAPTENKSRDRCESPAHHVDEDLRSSDVDARHQSDLLVSANGIDRPANGRSGQYEMADCDEDRSDDERNRYRSQKAAAEPEEPIDIRLR